jgi:hypothetical protein
MIKNVILSIFLLIHFLFLHTNPIWYVDINNLTGIETGSQQYPFSAIQTALDVSNNRDSVFVAQGNYAENCVIYDGISIFGGFMGGSHWEYEAGLGGNFETQDSNTYLTGILGDGTASVIQIDYFGGYGDYQLYQIEGFIIQDGQRGIEAMNWGNGGTAELLIANNIIQYNSGLTGSNDSGGGISARGMMTTLKNNHIRNNKCGKAAGFAIQLTSTTLSFWVEGNVIENNQIYSDHGAGAGVQAYKGVIKNNLFKNNSILEDWGWGGGLIIDGNCFSGFNNDVYVELSSNVYAGNFAPSGGSGLFIDEGANVRAKNELIIKNSTSGSFRNGALYVDGPRANSNAKTMLENFTIADNTGAPYSYGHAIFVEGGSEVIVQNSIFWNNQAEDNQNDFYVDESSMLFVDYSIFTEGMSGDGIFEMHNSFQADPLFAEPDEDDYHLKSKAGRWRIATQSWETDEVHSPAIDAGAFESEYDLEPIPNGTRINLGTYGNTTFASLSYSEFIKPQNIEIVVTDRQVIITWEAVLGATSYKVYSAESPDGEFAEETNGTFDGSSWSKEAGSDKKFYYVKALN